MTSWSVSIDAALLRPLVSLGDVVDQLLSLLEGDSTVLGPVTFMNSADQTFGARFSLDAPTMQAAIDRAVVVFSEVVRRLGVSFELRGGSVAIEDPVLLDQPDEIVVSI